MGTGAGIFLLAVGAVLTFAVHVQFSGVDLGVVGVILMLAGALGIVLDVALLAPRRRRTRTVTDGHGTEVRRETTTNGL